MDQPKLSNTLASDNSTTLQRRDLSFNLAVASHGHHPTRATAKLSGLRIQFASEGYRWLNETEMKFLAHLITNGTTDDFE